ncbi:LipA and NB-ARC domain-containing protein [Colletotrichum gloeosporioides Cg-14]|uniref:LipA and NB-ARC domain-containing protein n=1 Tax=Colletotrichum gloeosporioides (strain Cg-14) TaxID=1237896 RepID=T0L831_COLGC|nr:LipA and NB-ARC domain-containing protein [Colletotrichum gloeosporioides Cg-14]
MVAAKVTFLLSILALAAEIPLAQSHCLPPFPNNTNSSNTTHQVLRPSKAPLPVTISGTESNDPNIDGIHMVPSERLSASLCGASSYTSSTTATSPLVSDCRQLAEKIRPDKDYMTVYGYGDNHTLFPVLVYESCIFGVRPAWAEDVHTWQYGWYIGKKDIWQIANRVADEFEIDGRSSGNGLTHCVVNKYGSIQKTVSRFEITAVYTHPEANVDVVLVHGLNGDPKNTWTAKDGHNHSIFWPADLLPTSLRGLHANILVYGYNADVYSTKNDHSASDNFIYQHAQSLVTTLTLYRKSEGGSNNPIIWVAHSLGGLLVKRCLLYSNDVKDRNHEDYRAIFVSTYGIVFLGTPHGGSDMAKWGQMIQNMSDAIIPRKLFDSESVLLKTLKKDNETLQNINIHFLDIYQRFKIHMVHENHKTDIKGTKMLVVDARSAGPQLPGVTYYGIEATHSGMCKFPEQHAPGYRNVSTAIRDWVRESPSVIQTRWIVERDDKRVRAQTEAAERTREYSGTYSTPLISPSDTPSTTAFPSQAESQPDLRSSWPPFIHPDRFRPNAFFKGREEEHRDLHRMLMDTRRRSEGTSAVLIQGIPGAGKSHLARQYVFDHKDDYPGGIYWIRSTTVQDMEEGFWRIAKTEAIKQRVGQEKKDDLSDPQKMVKIVRNWFNEFNGWLLVLDGIRFDNDKVTNFIPDCKNTSLILTSTERPDPGNYLLDNPSIMELGLLPAQAARDLLLQEMGKRQPYTSDDLRRALELVQLMDHLPLMIHAAAQQMNATREPLAKYLKSFRDKPRPGMLPAYKTIRDQLQALGDTSALNLMYILCFFSQLVPVEMLALGLKALDRATPIRTDANGKPRSLNKTFITLIRFALIERSEMDDIPSSSSRTSERSDDPATEPLDVLRIHSVVQAFFIQLLAKEKQLEFWLARAARIFCLSFEAADDRMKKDPTTGLPDDYRRYAIHGRKLMEHLDRHYKSKDVSEDVAVELSSLRQNLKSKLSKLPKEIDGLQRAISAGIVDGKEVIDHCSVFERTNSLSSESTNTSNVSDGREPDATMPYVPQADSDNTYSTPRPPAHGPGSRYDDHFSDSRTAVPYPPDTVDASFDDLADPEWTVVKKHRSVKKQEQRRYHDRGGAWRETSVNDPRTSVSRESARGLISPPGSVRGGRSPSIASATPWWRPHPRQGAKLQRWQWHKTVASAGEDKLCPGTLWDSS